MQGKLKLIRWLLIGEDDSIVEEQYNPLLTTNFATIAKAMKKRAKTMLKKDLYDHLSWDCLTTLEELKFERGNKAPINNVHEEFPGISVVDKDNMIKHKVANAEELRALALASGGRDALLGHRCSPNPNTEISISFDHIGSISKVRYRPRSFSFGNLNVFSKCLNKVKSNYPNREQVRCLTI